ncbi:MAG: aspartate kinase [Phycisphaera sp.]|nr:aspartate kinase [Phycisphaera sp.]
MGVKVCKFGGTSVADANQFRKVQSIVKGDPERRYVVPSAPGKRHKDDRKITDLLYLCHEAAKQNFTFDEVFSIIADRYEQIVRDLGLSLRLGPTLDDVRRQIARNGATGGTADYAASRGEYLSGIITAELLGYEFIDAAEVIFFDAQGRYDDARTYMVLGERLKKSPRAVVPGFYGQSAIGAVKTFSRGGSDISGAIVARCAGADVYENWTDVSGLLMADPRIVENPRAIDTVTYRELRELAYMGATVLHDEAIFPVRKVGIPVNIRNTNDPDHPGTTILSQPTATTPIAHKITGIAGRKGFTVVNVEKAMMNAELGFGRRLLSVFEDNGVSYEHTPSGIDTMSVVVADSQINGKLERILEQLKVECNADAVDVDSDLALIATVGRGMAHTPGMAARLFNALAEASVNIRMIDQGSSELNIIVGVSGADFEKAVRAIYRAFVD